MKPLFTCKHYWEPQEVEGDAAEFAGGPFIYEIGRECVKCHKIQHLYEYWVSGAPQPVYPGQTRYWGSLVYGDQIIDVHVEAEKNRAKLGRQKTS